MYKLLDGGYVAKGKLSIPNDPKNKDWQEYQAWLGLGNTPDPIDPEPTPTYAELRRAAYPPMADYNDAKVKQASTDTDVQAEGLAQEQAYLEACLAVKDAFPKV